MPLPLATSTTVAAGDAKSDDGCARVRRSRPWSRRACERRRHSNVDIICVLSEGDVRAALRRESVAKQRRRRRQVFGARGYFSAHQHGGVGSGGAAPPSPCALIAETDVTVVRRVPLAGRRARRAPCAAVADAARGVRRVARLWQTRNARAALRPRAGDDRRPTTTDDDRRPMTTFI